MGSVHHWCVVLTEWCGECTSLVCCVDRVVWGVYVTGVLCVDRVVWGVYVTGVLCCQSGVGSVRHWCVVC